jgi:ribosomal protein L35
MAGFKMKTRKAAAKRFRKATAKGKIVRSKGHHGHFLAKRGQKARQNQGTTYVNPANFNQVNALVPALGAKSKRSRSIKNALRRAAAAKVSTAGKQTKQVRA